MSVRAVVDRREHSATHIQVVQNTLLVATAYVHVLSLSEMDAPY